VRGCSPVDTQKAQQDCVDVRVCIYECSMNASVSVSASVSKGASTLERGEGKEE